MNLYMKAKLKELSESGLNLFYDYTVGRIKSHIFSYNPNANYIRKQEEILQMILEELQKRKKDSMIKVDNIFHSLDDK